MRAGKCDNILRVLRSRILRGVYEGRMPGIRELSSDLGVSTVTMGLALMQLEAVGLIERRPRSGTFVVPPSDRLKTFAPMSVLLNASPVSTAGVSNAFCQAAQTRGLEVALSMYSYADTAQAIHDVLRRLRNITCLGACVLDRPITPAEGLTLSQARGVVVLGDVETQDVLLSAVNHDNAEAGRMAATHLLRLGHREVLFADPMILSPNRKLRMDSAAEVVRQIGGRFHYAGPPGLDWGASSAATALRELGHITAVICGCHKTALDIRAAAQSLGLSVPRDLSIVTTGNLMPDHPEEPVTHIDFDGAALGAAALTRLLESSPGDEPRHVMVPVRLVDCGTTAPPKQP